MAELLRNTPWQNAKKTPIAGDLSSRRYWRLTQANQQTAILMDASGHADTVLQFVAMTNWLHEQNLSAPDILLSGSEALLIEDFGNTQMSDLVGTTKTEAYGLSLKMLLQIRNAKPPNLLAPSAKELTDLTLISDCFPTVPNDGLCLFRARLETHLSEICEIPATLSLRDFHADNVMWLPDRTDQKKLGLLDYQDAFLTHPVYDLVSLLTDARVDIAMPFQNDMIEKYAAESGDDLNTLRFEFAVFSAQRNLRILGIFAKAARNGKKHHIAKVPRVWRYFRAALDHPAFTKVQSETLRALPEPTDKILAELSS